MGKMGEGGGVGDVRLVSPSKKKNVCVDSHYDISRRRLRIRGEASEAQVRRQPRQVWSGVLQRKPLVGVGFCI